MFNGDLSQEIEIILGFVTAFVAVLLAMPSLIKVAHLKNLIDEPDDNRKLHGKRIPTLGGIMIFAGTIFAYFLWFPFYKMNSVETYGELLAAVNDFKLIGASMLIIFFVGVKDDIFGTAPAKKLAAHLLVAFILVLMGDVRIKSMFGIFGITEELPYAASVFLSIFTYIVIVNAFNLIDGIDGLAGGIGLIASAAFGIWFYLAGNIQLAVLAFALAGSLLGFLIFNFPPARIFMGDSGSMTIGLILSVLAIKLLGMESEPKNLEYVSKPIFVLACLGYPLVDTLRIFVYRTLTGSSPFKADRNHIHHRCMDIGLKHSYTSLAIYAYSVILIVLAVTIDLAAEYFFYVLMGVAFLLAQIPFFIKKKKGLQNLKVVKKTVVRSRSQAS